MAAQRGCFSGKSWKQLPAQAHSVWSVHHTQVMAVARWNAVNLPATRLWHHRKRCSNPPGLSSGPLRAQQSGAWLAAGGAAHPLKLIKVKGPSLLQIKQRCVCSMRKIGGHSPQRPDSQAFGGPRQGSGLMSDSPEFLRWVEMAPGNLCSRRYLQARIEDSWVASPGWASAARAGTEGSVRNPSASCIQAELPPSLEGGRSRVRGSVVEGAHLPWVAASQRGPGTVAAGWRCPDRGAFQRCSASAPYPGFGAAK